MERFEELLDAVIAQIPLEPDNEGAKSAFKALDTKLEPTGIRGNGHKQCLRRLLDGIHLTFFRRTR